MERILQERMSLSTMNGNGRTIRLCDAFGVPIKVGDYVTFIQQTEIKYGNVLASSRIVTIDLELEIIGLHVEFFILKTDGSIVRKSVGNGIVRTVPYNWKIVFPVELSEQVTSSELQYLSLGLTPLIGENTPFKSYIKKLLISDDLVKAMEIFILRYGIDGILKLIESACLSRRNKTHHQIWNNYREPLIDCLNRIQSIDGYYELMEVNHDNRA